MTGPDRDCIAEPLVAVIGRRPPQVELSADARNVVRKHGDVVALPLAIVERDGLRSRAPLDRESATPHCAGVFVAD